MGAPVMIRVASPARIDRVGVRHNTQAETGGAAAVFHALADIHAHRPLDRIVLAQDPLDGGLGGGDIVALGGVDQRHAAVGEGDELAVEEVGANGIGKREL